MGLTASSNAAMALIVDHLTQHPELSDLLLNQLEMANMANKYTSNHQQIFYGAPGTGKSNTIKREVDEKGKTCFRTTFHPDSDYSTFVGAYKPSMKPTGVTLASGEREEVITYKFIPQAFTRAYVEAWKTTKDVFLVIEEINRGNCAQIFGDLFQLLDRKDGVSEYPVEADTDLATCLSEALADSQRKDIPLEVQNGRKLILPSNLYIWATMNTSDQSLFPIDSAFKRRWEWKYIPIDTKKETWSIAVDGVNYSWTSFLEIVNERVLKATSSEDKQLGFYFCKAQNNVVSAETFVSKVLFYLWNDVFKDYDEGESIFKDAEGKALPFSKFYKTNGDIDTAMVDKLLTVLEVENDKKANASELAEDA
ncbi:MAG: AAA family ATPase [Prevotella sp.]|nr:AAA family ATPase [Prevotella sp.]